MTLRVWRHAFAAALALSVLTMLAATGCSPTGDPSEGFIVQIDAAPPQKRPPDWERTKRLMGRPAPAVGGIAPDFTLTSLDGKQQITRSTYQRGRPLVLVFGSFT